MTLWLLFLVVADHKWIDGRNTLVQVCVYSSERHQLPHEWKRVVIPYGHYCQHKIIEYKT
jgi:hypothetical protein